MDRLYDKILKFLNEKLIFVDKKIKYLNVIINENESCFIVIRSTYKREELTFKHKKIQKLVTTYRSKLYKLKLRGSKKTL